MNTSTKIFLLFSWGLSLIISFSIGTMNREREIKDDMKFQLYKNQSLIDTIDSLRWESFIQKTNVDRYEIALELLRQEDSLSAIKYENKLNSLE